MPRRDHKNLSLRAIQESLRSEQMGQFGFSRSNLPSKLDAAHRPSEGPRRRNGPGRVHPMSLTVEEQKARESLVKMRAQRSKYENNVETVPPLQHRAHLSSVNHPSFLTSNLDREMAQRQLRYNSLSPQEQDQQEAWAQQQLNALRGHGLCAMGWPWVRIPGNAYRCEGMEHLVIDELLAEGKGGHYVMAHGTAIDNPSWAGPFYGNEMWEYLYGPGAGPPPPGHWGGGWMGFPLGDPRRNGGQGFGGRVQIGKFKR
ncbi:hypothetical protein N431DRAFT_466128 [Stipitochalara longipes BDJ]|nr:hypothetical protein N431DRAFT_466128 [Stipitochalara longipes BDJ]